MMFGGRNLTGKRLRWALMPVVLAVGVFFGAEFYRETVIAQKVRELGGRTEWQAFHVRSVTDLRDIDDATFRHLADDLKKLTCLTSLDIASPRLTDAGVSALKDLDSLEWLYLGGQRLTDASVVHLKHLNRLEYLSLRDTNLTEQGAKELWSSLPTLKKIKMSNVAGRKIWER
jgi:hypothetical protein